MNTLALWLYSVLVWLAQPLLKRKLHRRAIQEPGYGVAIEERFGHYSSDPSQGWVWVHAVSLGETRAAAVLIEALRQQWPGMRLLLTHGTATGREAGKALLQSGDVQVWLPWDAQDAVNQFLNHFQPRMGILMETEVWPNLVHACAKKNIPLALVNARLNEKSLRKSLRLCCLAQPAFAALHLVLAQTQDDAQRLKQLGAPVTAVLGNLKFDQAPSSEQLLSARLWRESRPAEAKPVVLLASSREGEETLWLDAVQAVHANVQWLVVPRHPQRFDEVAQLLVARGYDVQRKSRLGEAGFADTSAGIWLGDTLGEMAWYYGIADAALLGGSFLPLGGQNLIEACACACPVIMGPHTFNFAQASEWAEQAGAALRVTDMGQAVNTAVQWCGDVAEQRNRSAKALEFAQSQQGVADATARHLQPLWAAQGAAPERTV